MNEKVDAVQESIKLALDAADAATDVTSEYNTIRKQNVILEAKVKQIHKYTTVVFVSSIISGLFVVIVSAFLFMQGSSKLSSMTETSREALVVFAENVEGVKGALEQLQTGIQEQGKILETNNALIASINNLDNNLNNTNKMLVTEISNLANNVTKNMNSSSKKNMQELNKLVKTLKDTQINTIVISNTNTGKSVAPLLACMLNSGLITNAIDYPEKEAPLTINCKAFSSKAYAKYESNYEKNIITILPNSIGEIVKKEGEGKMIDLDLNRDHMIDERLKIKNRNKLSGKISLSDAEIVVSAGRGLKGSENWGMIEELAELLGAGTACSKPVSDMGWRPHSEHVGQTGLAINPNLYIAIGISGAIQHLAGMKESKIIVAINKDEEAPIFNVADYGLCADLFEALPQLSAELDKLNTIQK